MDPHFGASSSLSASRRGESCDCWRVERRTWSSWTLNRRRPAALSCECRFQCSVVIWGTTAEGPKAFAENDTQWQHSRPWARPGDSADPCPFARVLSYFRGPKASPESEPHRSGFSVLRIGAPKPRGGSMHIYIYIYTYTHTLCHIVLHRIV